MKDHVDWSSGGGPAELGSSKQAEVCRPDYEKLIAEKRASLDVTQNLFDATKDYIFHYPYETRQSPLKDLLGHLLIEAERLQQAIAELIARQAKDATKDQG